MLVGHLLDDDVGGGGDDGVGRSSVDGRGEFIVDLQKDYGQMFYSIFVLFTNDQRTTAALPPHCLAGCLPLGRGLSGTEPFIALSPLPPLRSQ